MDMKPVLRLLSFFIAATLLLTGCVTTGGAARTTGDAASAVEASSGPIDRMMQAVGLAKTQLPAATEQNLPLRIFTAPNLNAGSTRKALALVVKVYHLRSLDRFNQTPFNDFLDNAKTQAALGSDLIDSREMLLLPDQHYTSTEHMPVDTRYVAFVALFRAPGSQRWRFAYDVKGSADSGITLGVHGCAMSSTAGALVTELSDSPDSLASVHCTTPGS
ncbi:type VI secretion system protein VasD [Rhodanobacter sp. TND4EL1]